MESGSHIDCLGPVWILGMLNLALELLLDHPPWWFGSFGFRVSQRFARDSFVGLADGGEFWTLPSGFHPIRFQVLQTTWRGFLLFHFIHHPATYFSSFVSFDISRKAFWILGHHTETFLIALPASPAHWDCWEIVDFYRGPVPWFVWLQRGIDLSTRLSPYSPLGNSATVQLDCPILEFCPLKSWWPWSLSMPLPEGLYEHVGSKRACRSTWCLGLTSTHLSWTCKIL